MLNRRLLLKGFLTSAAVLCLVQRGMAGAPEPGEGIWLITRLYEEHAKRAKDRAIAPLWVDPATRASFFTADILKAFAEATKRPKELGEPILDGDPIYDAQDWEIRDLWIGPAEARGDKMSVKVSFKNFQDERRLDYSLLNTDSGWRIDDIAYDHGENSYRLRGILEGSE